jgi:hypothetical protein
VLELLIIVFCPVLDVVVVDIDVLGALVVKMETSAAATLGQAVSVEYRRQVGKRPKNLSVRRPKERSETVLGAEQSLGEACEQRRKQGPLRPQASS